MMTLFVAVLMILSALVIALPGAQGRENGMNPAATASGTIQPNPILNTNVSWSTFYSTWAPLEYSNGSANLSLNAGMSTFYSNPISINPADLVASKTLQNDIVGGKAWGSTTNTTGAISSGGVGTVISHGIYTTAGVNEDYISTNTTDAGSTNDVITPPSIPIADYPSNNILYDYLTVAFQLKGPHLTGANAYIIVENQTTYKQIDNTPTGESFYLSENLYQLSKQTGLGFNTSGKGASDSLAIQVFDGLPQTTLDYQYNLTLTAYAMTDYPITLGTNSTGAEPATAAGNVQLAKFNPAVPMSVINSGYSVAVSQPMQNLTTQQSAINSGGYIEQVEYQGQFNLPTAPDLSYGAANITEYFNVNTSQTQVLDINGVSYLSAITGKNSTIQLLSSVNPNGQTQFLQIVDYTQSQWTSISSPPGIFTLAGIEYYWEEFIIAILAVVGVGAGAASRHASNLRKVK
jgi:hypothetical protein